MPILDSRTVRNLLNNVLHTDADLEAFLIDYFPEVQKRISSQMNRVAKINLLFECSDSETIATHLHRAYPAVLADPSIRGGNTPGIGRLSAVSSPVSVSEPAKQVPSRRESRNSPWLEVAKTTRGQALLIGATVLSLLATVSNTWVLSPLERFGLFVVPLLLAGAAVAMYVTAVRRRQRINPVSLSRFVGPQPMTKTDRTRRGFYGRDEEIEKLVRKLSSAELRHLILLGESGCGKTSLLLAGVIPEVELQGLYHPIYLRFSDHPIQALREALLGDRGAISTSASSLVDEVRAAWVQLELPVILFIDQFEEFHVNPISEADYQSIRELVWAIAGKQATLNAKIVFCLRYDFLHLMDVFYDEDRVDKGFANGEVRIRIEPFEAPIAEEVVYKTLARPDGHGLEWSEPLVDRVLDDLTMERIIHGQRKKIVLPSELQIVFQMVQAKRITQASAYPGKRRLLLDYVGEAIDTAPGSDPVQVKQLLLCLVNPNGITRAQPQTLLQLAVQLRQEPLRLRRMLDHLDHHRHLIRSFSSKQTDGSMVVVYELGHDYLTSVIRSVAGAELSGTRRSQAILYSGRLQTDANRSFRLSLTDCWHLYRYPPEGINPEDRRLIRRSVAAFAFTVCGPTVVSVLAILAVRFGTAHLDVEQNEIVIKRGLPYLEPLLGDRQIWIATSIKSNSPIFQNKAGQQFVADIHNGHFWSFDTLSPLSNTFSIDSVLTGFIMSFINEHLNELFAGTALPDWGYEELEEVNRYVASFDDRKQATAVLISIIEKLFNEYKQKCSLKQGMTRGCMGTQFLIQKFGEAVRQLHPEPFAPNSPTTAFVADMENQAFNISAGWTWGNQTALSLLDAFRLIDREMIRKRETILLNSDAEFMGHFLKALAEVDKLSVFISNAGRAQASRTLLAIVKELTTNTHQRDAAQRALDELDSSNQEFIEYLVMQLKSSSMKARSQSLRSLLSDDIHDERIINYIVGVLSRGNDRLAEVDSVFGTNVIGFKNEYDAAITEAQIVIDVMSHEKKYNIRNERFAAIMREFMKSYRQKTRNLWNDYDFSIMVGIAVRMGIDLKATLSEMPIDHTTYSLLIEDIFMQDALNAGVSHSHYVDEQLYAADELIAPTLCQELDIKKMTHETGYLGCLWMTAALLCSTPDVNIDKKLFDPDCSFVELFKAVYIKKVLTPQGSTMADIKKLLALLDTRLAAQSTAYRYSVADAIYLMASKVVRQPQGIAQVSALVQQLSPDAETHPQRVHQRLIRNYLQDGLGMVISKAQRRQQSVVLPAPGRSSPR